MNAKGAFGFCGYVPAGWFLCGLLWICFLADGQAATESPVITSIRRDATNIVVAARVPAGIYRLTLEGRARLGPGAWEPRAVARLDGSGGTTTFRVACSRDVELLRLRGDANEPLPASFYSGTNQFTGEAASSSGPPGSPLADARAGAPGAGGAPTQAEPSRDVVESDIWHIRGETLYFFNQYRGLQVIDITNPDTAVVRGTLRLPASGEEMYLLGSEHVVLLARNGCYYNTGQESQVLVIKDNAGTPEVVASLPLAGYITESRMVGTALYVASQAYRQVAGTNSIWEWGTLVSSFDLANAAAPVSRSTLWYSGYGNVVSATEDYLFVIGGDGTNWQQSLVRIIDITQPNGTMKSRGALLAAGQIPDKFKLNYSPDRELLTVISQLWGTQQLETRLETFHLGPGDSGPPAKLGSLMVGINEQLHATRFDGERAYIVTFHVQFRLDPLWIVDLSDPAHPAITGQLEVPGWSTFLQPLGSRLLALGIETNSTTVSLFDVADPADPRLLSRVPVGNGWSWTEANWDEHAFGVFPDANMVLVPFQSWTSNQYVQQVQLVDLFADSLAKRGVIDHDFQPRRARIHGDRILSISGRELLSVKFSNRDQPMVRGTTELAWPVDRVVLAGDYLIEVANGSRSWGWWGSRWPGDEAEALLRVTLAADSEHVLGSLSLGNLAVSGVSKQGNYLYVAQAPAAWFFPPYVAPAGSGDQTDTFTNDTPLVVTVIDLSNLPHLSILGRVETKPGGTFSGGELQPVWPKPGVLVWAGGGMDYWWWWRLDGPMPLAAGRPGGLIAWPWFWPSSASLLMAFDVSDPAMPAFASKIDLTGTNRWSFSTAFAAEGLVYSGHQTSEFVPGLDTVWKTPARTNVTIDVATGETNVVITPAGSWLQRSFLDVVDYADAVHPTVREPVNISGGLQGISHQGALLYTTRSESRSITNTNGYVSWTWTEQLDALAYDGVSAHLLDSLALPTTWPQPLRFVGNSVFLGRSGYDYYSTNRDPNYLETWAIADTGKFAQLGRAVLTDPASALQDFPGMLVAQQNANNLVLFDLAEPANLKVIGRGSPLGCLWFDLNHADGNASQGLWLPLGGFGVGTVALSK